MPGHGALQRIENLPAKNDKERKRDCAGCEQERQHLRFDSVIFGCALSGEVKHVNQNKRSDDQRLRLRETADDEQNEAEVQIAALQKEKSCDQERRKIDVEVSEADTVEGKRQLECRGENEIAGEPIKARCSDKEEEHQRKLQDEELRDSKCRRAARNGGKQDEREWRIIGPAMLKSTDQSVTRNVTDPVDPNRDIASSG